MSSSTILIAEPHRLIRESLADMLRKKLRMHVLEAATSERALRLSYSARPDAMLLSWELPGMHPGELVKHLAEHLAEMRLIVMTPRPLAEPGLKGEPWGSLASLSKHSSLEELCMAISMLTSGGVCEPVAQSVAGNPESAVTYFRDATGRALTRRELEIVSRLVKGKTSKVIAAEL